MPSPRTHRWVYGTLIALAVVRLAWTAASHANENDFAHYYVSSWLLLHGENPYTTALAPLYARFGFTYEPRISVATNPPLLVWFFAPFSALPPRVAHAIWTLMQGVCLLGMLALLRRTILCNVSSKAWRWFILGVLLSAPLLYHVRFGQVQLLISATLLLAYILHTQSRHSGACVLVSIVTVLKLFPAALLPWFWLHQSCGGRRIAARVAWSLAISAGLMWVGGWKLWQGFAHNAGIVTANAVNQTGNQSLPSLLLNVVGWWCGFGQTTLDHGHWWLLANAVGLLLIGAGYVLVLCLRMDARHQIALLLCVGTIGGAVCWVHYLVLLFMPVAVLIAEFPEPRLHRRVLSTGVLLGLSLPPLTLLLSPKAPMGLRIALNYTPLYAALALAVLLAVREHGKGQIQP